MTFDDYKKFAFMIIQIMKDFEREGEDNVKQSDIVERMVNMIEI